MPIRDSRNDPSTPHPRADRRYRSAGQAVGCTFAAAVTAAVAVFCVNIFTTALHAARGATCRANLNQVSTALSMYCADYDERLPPARSWSDNLYPYTKNWAVFRCTERQALPGGFAFNEALSQKKLKDVNHDTETPAIFESSLGVLNASDRLESFMTPHRGTGSVIFANGQIKRLSAAPAASAGIVEPKADAANQK